MKHITRDHPAIGDVFGLDHIVDLHRVERVALPSSEDDGHRLYLFRCENLLPEGHKLAIDDCRGVVGVYRESTALKEIAVSRIEIAVLTALALSFPFSVGEYQIQNVARLYRMDEQDLVTTPTTGDAQCMNIVQDVVAACNRRLRPLGLTLLSIDAAYQLITVSEEKH